MEPGRRVFLKHNDNIRINLGKRYLLLLLNVVSVHPKKNAVWQRKNRFSYVRDIKKCSAVNGRHQRRRIAKCVIISVINF